jgi:hypothetical protein
MFNGIDLTTRTTTYDTSPAKPDKEKVINGTASDPPSTTVTPPYGPLQIEKPTFDSILCPAKSIIRKSTFNHNSCVAQNYNIVEYFSQAPCVMSSLKGIQHCPSQHRTLLATIKAIDLDSSNNIMSNFKS